MIKIAPKTILVFLLIMGLSSCLNDDTHDSKINDSDNFSKEVEITSLDVSSLFQPLKLEGKFQYWLTETKDLVLYTSTNTHKEIFILQGINLNQIDIGNIKALTFLDHSILVESTEGYY